MDCFVNSIVRQIEALVLLSHYCYNKFFSCWIICLQFAKEKNSPKSSYSKVSRDFPPFFTLNTLPGPHMNTLKQFRELFC